VREREFRFRRPTKSPQTGDEASKFRNQPAFAAPLVVGRVFFIILFTQGSISSENYISIQLYFFSKMILPSLS
jgi:hypothetical protein